MERYHVGRHVKGLGQASEFMPHYRDYFNCPMYATYNVRMGNDFKGVQSFDPAISVSRDGGIAQLWLCHVHHTRSGIMRKGWIYRAAGTRQPKWMVEIVTRQALPMMFLTPGEEVTIEIKEKWDKQEIDRVTASWFPNKWHPTFDWGPNRVNSNKQWDAVRPEIDDWSGVDVLDIGCNYGFHSFKAAAAGAIVTGLDNKVNVERASIIADHIEMLDVEFDENLEWEKDATVHDVIFYFSVHHQIDPKYDHVHQTITNLRKRVRKALFVELILPGTKGATGAHAHDLAEESSFGGYDAKILHTYKHSVRGTRRIWKIFP